MIVMPDETRKERRAPQVLATLAGVLAAFLLAAACYVGWQAVHILFPQTSPNGFSCNENCGRNARSGGRCARGGSH